MDIYSDIDHRWNAYLGTIRQQSFHVIPKDRNIVIFGAGDRGFYAHRDLSVLGKKIICFTDNNVQKQGTKFLDLEVVDPKHLKNIIGEGIFAVIAVGNKKIANEISKQLNAMNIESVVYNPGWHSVSVDELDYVYKNCLSDNRSKYVFYCYFRSRCENDDSYYKRICEGDQYFGITPFSFENNNDFVFLDLGAYDGDTLEMFMKVTKGNFNKIISFEPTPELFKILEQKTAQLKHTYNWNDGQIECIRKGIGERNETVEFFIYDEYLSSEQWSDKFNMSGNSKDTFFPAQREKARSINVEIVSLDNYLENIDIKKITMIKADIEGAELSMLKGAYKTIKKDMPALAISIYHKSNDICEIPIYIKKHFPEYNLFMRHHSNGEAELVLYCITNNETD